MASIIPSGRSSLDAPTLKELNWHVRPMVASMWYDLGEELLQNIAKLHVIRANHSGDVEACCTEMFMCWLREDLNASWNKLVKALRLPSVGLNALADEIEQKFLIASDDVKAAIAHRQAIKGERKANQFKIVMLGAEGAGKTSTVASLLDKPFQPNQSSTVGVDTFQVEIQNTLTVGRIFVSNWNEKEIQQQLKEVSIHYRCEIKDCMTESLNSNEMSEETFQIFQPEEIARAKELLQNEDKPDGDVRVIVYDLGGQEIYYELQFLFLASHDVVFLTFDASKDLNATVIRRHRYASYYSEYKTRKELTTLEAIEIALHTIHSRCEGYDSDSISRFIPVVVMVATHAKNLNKKEKSVISRNIITHLRGKRLSNHLVREFWGNGIIFIDNEERDEAAFAHLKLVAIKAAGFTINKHRYISYLNFEKEILEISQRNPVITKEHAFHIAKEAGLEANEEALLKLLQYYTNKGILLYYPEVEALKDTVFISPQEVADLVSTVIKTHEYTTKTLPDSNLDKKCVRFDKHGLLEEELLDDLLEKAGRIKDKRIIIAFLEKFGLAVEVEKDTKFENEIPRPSLPDTGRVFFVPSMLIYNETAAPCSVEGFTDNVILYHFPDQFLSDNFFNHVLILIIKWSIKNHHRVCRIYRGIGFFDFQSGKQNFTLQYCSTSYSIKCYITVHRNEVHNEDLWVQRLKLFEHLKQCIGEVHSSLMPKATPPDCCIYCPLHDKDDPGPHLPFVGDMQLFKYCTVLRKDVPPSAYNLLVKPNKQPRLVECAVFIDDIADKTNKPAMKELNRYVVTKYAVKWKEIGGELGLKPSVINNIAADFQSFDRNKHENCLKEVFKKWLEVDTGACWKKLELVLTNVDRAGQNFPPVSDIYDSTLNESKGNTYTEVEESLVRQHAQYSTKEWIKLLLVFCFIIVVFVVCMYRFTNWFTNWPDIVSFVSFW